MTMEYASGGDDDVLMVPEVVRIHVEEAATLYDGRAVLTRAPHITLFQLRQSDDRMAAHLDGVAVAGEAAWPFCFAALEQPSPGAAFVATVRALESRQQPSLEHLLAMAAGAADTARGVVAAFGWIEPEKLQGQVPHLLAASCPFQRLLGVATCAMHRVDPGLIAAVRLQDSDAAVRARALRTAGELGCLDAGPLCTATLDDEDDGARFWSAWSSVLLGARGKALDVLAQLGTENGSWRQRAFRLMLQASAMGPAHALLQQIARDPTQLRWLIEGSGIVGDPRYVAWLIGFMTKDETARLAGEAFTLITGADLDKLQLYRERPDDFESGPTDDPADDDVAMDPDEGLMWPDAHKVDRWWAANRSRFQNGQRYFMGAPVTREHCIDVLRNGYQRQRILAAHYLCLLEPGTPLFNTSAPAWRQQRLLAQMT